MFIKENICVFCLIFCTLKIKQKQKTQNVYTLEYNKQRIDLKKYKKIILLYTFIVSSNSLNFQQNRVKIGHKSVTNS